MIKTKKDYIKFLESDLAANNLNGWKWTHRYSKRVMHFQRTLRRVEYFKNCRKDAFGKLYLKFLMYQFIKMSVNLGFTIPPNVFGLGLSIAHYGSIVINSNAKIGKNCRIHSATNIGAKENFAPIIGDNVYIAPGAKIYGNIRIGNNVEIGANAVVNRDVPDNCTVVGSPSKIVKLNGTSVSISLKEYWSTIKEKKLA